jgi:hypothetical protein
MASDWLAHFLTLSDGDFLRLSKPTDMTIHWKALDQSVIVAEKRITLR